MGYENPDVIKEVRNCESVDPKGVVKHSEALFGVLVATVLQLLENSVSHRDEVAFAKLL